MKTLTVILGLLFSISLSAATDEAALLKAVRNFDFEDEIDTDALVFCGSIDVEGGYTVAAFYDPVSGTHGNITYLFLLKKAASSYRVIELIDVFTTDRGYSEPLDFLENVGAPKRRFFAYGYEYNLAGGRSIDFDCYILYRVKEDAAERLFVGYTDVYDSYFPLEAYLWDLWWWRGACSYQYSYDYAFVDIGDEVPLLLHSEYLKGQGEASEKLEAVRLFRYEAQPFDSGEVSMFSDHFVEGAGAYVEVPETLYSDILAGTDDPTVKFLLADRARRFECDVPKAIRLYGDAFALTDDERIKAGAAAEINELSFYEEDPKEAVILYDSGVPYGTDPYYELFESYPDSRVAALARYNIGGLNNYYEFVSNYPESPRWSKAVLHLCYVALGEGAGDVTLEEIEPYVLKASKDDDLTDDEKVYTLVQFALWAKSVGDYDMALEYYQKGYDACQDDGFRENCLGLMAMLYDETGKRKKAFTTAIGISGYSPYDDGLGPIIGSYEVLEDGHTVTIAELADDGELHFASVQLDGAGEEEILAWKLGIRRRPYQWLRILNFDGDKLRTVYNYNGTFHGLHIEAGLDERPCVYTDVIEANEGEIEVYKIMSGYYDGEYKELGKFYLGHCPQLISPEETRFFEVRMEFYGRKRKATIVGFYESGMPEWFFNEFATYTFDEGQGYFILDEER